MSRLRERRKELGYSLKEVAELSGLSPSGVQAVEVGDRPTPLDETVRRLARVYEMEPEAFRSSIPVDRAPRDVKVHPDVYRQAVLVSRVRDETPREVVERAIRELTERELQGGEA